MRRAAQASARAIPSMFSSAQVFSRGRCAKKLEPRKTSMGSHALKLEPLDAYNLALTENLHPAGWVNPTPADRYNMVVIGAGTAGLVTAAGAAILGAKA